MAVLPADFLKVLVAETAEIIKLQDSSKNLKETDPILTACARIAIVQINDHCQKPFHYGARTVVFNVYTGPLLLPTTPVDTQQPIVVRVNDEIIAASDWEIVRNRLVLYGDNTDDPDNVRYENIEFEATTGIQLCETIPTLYAAAQIQSIGNYNRRESYGLMETSGERGISRQPSDSGELLDSVKTMLSKLVYTGLGFGLDEE